MKKLLFFLLIVLNVSINADDPSENQKKINLLDSDDAKVRQQTKTELLKHAFLYTKELKANVNNSSLEIQDACKEILKKYYSYTSELMQNHNIPLLTKENSKEAKSQKYAKWVKKNYLSAYQKNGKKNIKWDSNVEKLLSDVCELYALNKGSAKEIAERAKNIIDLGCEDLYVTYTYANMCYNAQNFEIARNYFLKCEVYLQQGDYSPLFYYFVMNKLSYIGENIDAKAKYANAALAKIAEVFDKATSQEDIDEFSALAFDFSQNTLKYLPAEVLKKLIIPDCKNEIGKIFLSAYKMLSGKVQENKIEFIENLDRSIPKNAQNLITLSKLFANLYKYIDENERTIAFAFKVLEMSPESIEFANKILDSLTDNRDRHYDPILFGAEYFASLRNSIGVEVFLTSYWQLICSESHYQYLGWIEVLDSPQYKALVKDAFAEIEKIQDLNPYQKSMIGVNAYLQKDFKVALQEINNYQNEEFQHRKHAYIAKEKILSEVLPLKYLNNTELIEYCSKVNSEPFSVARAQLFLKCYDTCKTEKQKFYISRLVHFTRFTENGEINEALCQILLELGFEELIIKNFIDYNNEFHSSPIKVLEFIKIKLDPLTVSLFEISKPWKCISSSQFNETKLKIEEKFNELNKNFDFEKNLSQSNLLNAKKEIAIARALYYLIYKNVSIADEDNFYSLKMDYSCLQIQEFYEAYSPFLGINKKQFSSFLNSDYMFLGKQGGYMMSKVEKDKSIKTEYVSRKKIPEIFKNEEEAYAFVRIVYKERLGSLYKLNLYNILVKQGYSEIAEYICINTFSNYIDLLIHNKTFGYNLIRDLFQIGGIHKYTHSLLFLTLYSHTMPKGIDLLEVIHYLLTNKEFFTPMYFEYVASEGFYYPNKYNGEPKYVVKGKQVGWQEVIIHITEIVNQETSLKPEQKENLLRLIKIMKTQMEKR